MTGDKLAISPRATHQGQQKMNCPGSIPTLSHSHSLLSSTVTWRNMLLNKKNIVMSISIKMLKLPATKSSLGNSTLIEPMIKVKNDDPVVIHSAAPPHR